MKQYTPTIKYATNTAPVKIKQEPDSEPSFTFISATETNPQSLLDPNIMVKVECIDLTDETDEAPVTIVKTPVKFFKKPAKVVKKKAKVVKEPAKVVKKKAKVIETPVKFVETPVKFVETPVKFFETPV
ncbi:hypothetical protein NPIL_647351 [Nephila pilipes]|nr:hypothetical protein NPIL_536561 [Nephila pilipes]GFU00995.1 hypothetical protein NPIL_647351 [Nephila pilipes]